LTTNSATRMSLFKFLFSRIFIKQFAFGLLFVLVMFLILKFVLSAYTNHGDSVLVPELKGLTLSEAGQLLESNNLFFQVIDSVYNEKERGTVLDQLPRAGNHVKESRIIFLTVNSMNPPMKTLNVRAGESLRIARTKLEILGIPFDVEYRPDICNECVLEMKYKGKSVVAGDRITKGDRIKLILGVQSNEKVLVPNLYGMRADSALEQIITHSLAPGVLFFDFSPANRLDSMAAHVIKQRPGPSNEPDILMGMPVDIWLSKEKSAQPK